MTPTSDSILASQVSRRSVLKMLGVGTVGTGLSYSRFKKPEPSVYGKDVLELPFYAKDRKKVAIVGGGLAGLAASHELSRRGFEVNMEWADGRLTKATMRNEHEIDVPRVMVQGEEVDAHSDPRFTIEID